MTTKHTPAPWFIEDERDDYCTITSEARTTKGDMPIVTVEYADALSNDDYADINAEQVANAHLIAAAPEILEALQKLVQRYSALALDNGRLNDDIESAIKFSNESTADARAAIAKATGESK